jgi:drug/metabolite transporter (DMT)-like permease
VVARARDIEAATAATFLLSVAIAAPFAAVFWSAEPSVWPYALASTLLETLYVFALAYAYRTTDLSFVYPLTRGLAPVIVLAVSVAVLGHAVSVAEVGGVLLVAAGVVLVRGPQGRGDMRAILVVLTIAATIAAYTLVDRVGIHHAGAITYFVLVLAGPSLVYPPVAGLGAVRHELGLSSLLAAGANVGSFTLGLLALRHGPAAPVLAVRRSRPASWQSTSRGDGSRARCWCLPAWLFSPSSGFQDHRLRSRQRGLRRPP